jgi:hypothetical protein
MRSKRALAPSPPLILLLGVLRICANHEKNFPASLNIVGRMQAPRNYYKSTKKIDPKKMLCKRRDGYTNARERQRS